MTSIKLQVAESVLAFALVALVVAVLKRRNVVTAEDGERLARLLTQVVLPAVIFSQLATHPITGQQFLMVLAMFLTGCTSLVVAWAAGKALRLERPRIGALMLTSAFGSSSLLGYPLVQFAFADNPQAMTDAVLLSELGVGLPIFILGPVIAMHFGQAASDKATFWRTFVDYLRSPIFIAVVVGLLASQLQLPTTDPFLAPFFTGFRMVDNAMTFIACFILGIQLDIKSVRNILLLVPISAAIQMGLQPLLASAQATLYHLSAEQQQVLVLISSMPSAVLGPVFATRFQCDGETAASLSFVNIVLSVVTIPAVFGTLAG